MRHKNHGLLFQGFGIASVNWRMATAPALAGPLARRFRSARGPPLLSLGTLYFEL
jgi:hypothetical protein